MVQAQKSYLQTPCLSFSVYVPVCGKCIPVHVCAGTLFLMCWHICAHVKAKRSQQKASSCITLRLTFKKFRTACIYLLGEQGCPTAQDGDQRGGLQELVLLSTICAVGIELGSLGLAVSALPFWAILSIQPYFMRQGLSLKLELSILSRRASQQATRIFPSLPLWYWGCVNTSPDVAWMWGLGVLTESY